MSWNFRTGNFPQWDENTNTHTQQHTAVATRTFVDPVKVTKLYSQKTRRCLVHLHLPANQPINFPTRVRPAFGLSVFAICWPKTNGSNNKRQIIENLINILLLAGSRYSAPLAK